jgi:multiple sugar transport system substrate-binding protein
MGGGVGAARTRRAAGRTGTAVWGAALTIPVLGTSCTSGTAPPPAQVGPATVRLTYWAEQAELEHWARLAEIAHAGAPQITIAPEVYEAGTDTPFAKLQVLWAGGTAPDVSRHKQKLYTLPLGGGPNPLFFNPRPFREGAIESPVELDARGAWTWDRFAGAARRLAQLDGETFKRAGYLVAFNVIRVAPWIWSNGGDYFNAERTKCTLAQGPAVEAIQYLADLRQKQRVGPGAGPAAPGVRWFPEQTVAVQLQPMTSMAVWRQDATFEFDAVANPRGKADQVGLLNDWSAGVVASTTVKDAAWEVLKQLTGPEAILSYSAAGRAFPWRKSVATAREFREKQPLKGIETVFKLGERSGRTIPYAVPWLDIQTIGNSALEEVRDGKTTPREALERIAREADRLLAL